MEVSALQRSNQKVGLVALIGAMTMLAMGFAAVPLYRMFCQVTGLGGTTQRVSEAQANAVHIAGKTISIRFDGNVERGLEWTFGPEQITQEVRIGQRTMAFFKARNNSDRAITGMASFNVEPEQAGRYFNKVHCFCFNKQTLQAGQEVNMPVQYFVDPAILQDPEAQDIEQITLSYTFHTAKEQAVKALDPANPAG